MPDVLTYADKLTHYKTCVSGRSLQNFRRKDPFVVCSFYFCVVNVDVTTYDSDIVEECLFKVSL